MRAHDGVVYVGAPFAAEGAGRVYALEGGAVVGVFEGPHPGAHVGAGPIEILDTAAGAALVVGCPASDGGKGAVAMFLPDGTLAEWVGGDQGSALGASLTSLVDIHHSGQPQMFVGAPGGSQSLGAVFALSPSFELSSSGVVGTAWGDRVGSSVAWRQTVDHTVELFVGAAGVQSPNAQWSGSWIRYE